MSAARQRRRKTGARFSVKRAHPLRVVGVDHGVAVCHFVVERLPFGHAVGLVQRAQDGFDRDRSVRVDQVGDLSAVASASPSGTTRLISPTRSASSAVMWRPVSRSSAAWARGTWRGRRTAEPAMG